MKLNPWEVKVLTIVLNWTSTKRVIRGDQLATELKLGGDEGQEVERGSAAHRSLQPSIRRLMEKGLLEEGRPDDKRFWEAGLELTVTGRRALKGESFEPPREKPKSRVLGPDGRPS